MFSGEAIAISVMLSILILMVVIVILDVKDLLYDIRSFSKKHIDEKISLIKDGYALTFSLSSETCPKKIRLVICLFFIRYDLGLFASKLNNDFFLEKPRKHVWLCPVCNYSQITSSTKTVRNCEKCRSFTIGTLTCCKDFLD